MIRRARALRAAPGARAARALLWMACIAALGGGCGRRPAAAPVTPELARFWTAFRGAVASGDAAAIAALARVPFTIRGPLDDDPKRTLDRAGLERAMDALLAQDCGLDERTLSMRDYIARLPALPPAALESGGRAAHVGVFEFALFPEGWRFTRATLER